MLSPLRRAARLVLLVCVLVPILGPSQGSAPGVSQPAHPVAAAEVRLRKLHLVRPDLIPYPIAYEVVC